MHNSWEKKSRKMNVPITDKIQSVFPPQLFSYIYASADKTLDVLSEPKNVAIVATAVFGVYMTYRHVNGNLKEKSFPDFPGATWYKDHRVMMRKTNSAGQFMKIVNKLGIPAGYIRFHFQKGIMVDSKKRQNLNSLYIHSSFPARSVKE